VSDTFAMIATQRRALVDVLDGLQPAEWSTPSLCGGWTVREVAGHLTMPFELGKAAFVLRMVRARGDYDKVADDFARQAARAPTASLVATLRANVDNRFTPPGFGPEAPLTDIVVHGLDIGVPIGRSPVVPGETATAILGFLVSPKATRGFVPKGLTAGLRFSGSDVDWAAGSGPSVSGPVASLVLTMTGRRAGLDGLGGDGLDELRRRLA
jgi:uncharacterized protein (TIGR03083 family)